MGELLPVTNPVNPILVAFRTEFEGYDLADVADSIQEWADNMHVMLAFASNPDQIEHARKVLTRLAHLAGQE